MNTSTYDANFYKVLPIDKREIELYGQYISLLKSTHAPLGFFRESVLPKEETQCFGLFFNESLEGIFAITPIPDISKTQYFKYIPNLKSSEKVAELSNVVLRKRFRGSVALGVILYEAAKHAVSGKYFALVGTTRQQTLPFFVDFGVTPVFHEPLHLMGDQSINDFVIYFETNKKESIDYMHTRAERFFQKELVLAKIRMLCSQRQKTKSQTGEITNAHS